MPELWKHWNLRVSCICYGVRKGLILLYSNIRKINKRMMNNQGLTQSISESKLIIVWIFQFSNFFNSLRARAPYTFNLYSKKIVKNLTLWQICPPCDISLIFCKTEDFLLQHFLNFPTFIWTPQKISTQILAKITIHWCSYT